MTTLIQILTAIAALGGCLVALVQLHRLHSIQTKRLEATSRKLVRREEAIQTLLGRYQETHRRLIQQLEQAEIYFDIEEELATRLAAAEGGKPVTKKSHARSAVMNRRKGDVELLTRVTTPSGIRDLKHRVDEAMIVDPETHHRRWSRRPPPQGRPRQRPRHPPRTHTGSPYRVRPYRRRHLQANGRCRCRCLYRRSGAAVACG